MNKLIFLLVLIMPALSCRKDNHHTLISACKNPQESSSSLVFGDYTGMQKIDLNVSISGGYSQPEKHFGYDIDNDGYKDFRLTAAGGGSPGVGQTFYLTLYTSASLNAAILSDADSTYQSISVSYEGSNPVKKHMYYYQTCSKLTEQDNLLSTKDKLRISNEGESLSIIDDWSDKASYSVGNSNLVYPTNYGTLENDTLPVSHSGYIRDCHNVFGTYYLGFKMTYSCGLIKLGWIKAQISGAYGMTIQEIAVQN